MIARLIVVSAIAFAPVSVFAEQFSYSCRFHTLEGQVVKYADRNFVVDFDRKTVDGIPADITEGEIKWQTAEENQSTSTTINRRTGYVSATSSIGSTLTGDCTQPRKRPKPLL